MRLLVIILSVISFTANGQDSICKRTVELLTDNVTALKLVIASQQKEIDRQDKMIFLLTDSILSLNKKVFVLANLNGTLKKKTGKQETWFKIGNALVSGLILYFTSKR